MMPETLLEAHALRTAQAYAVPDASSPLGPFTLERRALLPTDVWIDIHYCGICHSDIHQARNEWQRSMYPMVPGHEIVGTVRAVGEAVRRFAVGDAVGVGCMVDACRTCPSCQEGLEQFCEAGAVFTYNGLERDGTTPTYGGYSTHIVVDENFVLRLDPRLPLNKAAPLLCAGITTYSPLKHWQVCAGQRVGVVGLGGLGHMGVKLAVAMGAEVTVLSTSDTKKADALAFGAVDFINVRSQPEVFTQHQRQFDFLLNSVSAPMDYGPYLNLLKRDGTMVLLGVPDQPAMFAPHPLIMQRRCLAGSLIGGIAETQEMLDFCAQHGVLPEVEIIPIQGVNEAYTRMLNSDVRYRFVIDINSLRTLAAS
jgi:uncharacterized zinc-type alcohol dehydrogenase-like protein